MSPDTDHPVRASEDEIAGDPPIWEIRRELGSTHVLISLLNFPIRPTGGKYVWSIARTPPGFSVLYP